GRNHDNHHVGTSARRMVHSPVSSLTCSSTISKGIAVSVPRMAAAKFNRRTVSSSQHLSPSSAKARRTVTWLPSRTRPRIAILIVPSLFPQCEVQSEKGALVVIAKPPSLFSPTFGPGNELAAEGVDTDEQFLRLRKGPVMWVQQCCGIPQELSQVFFFSFDEV